jgi:pyruvate/2-oxoglutarate dehydrogenase complex dihydrolipoamide acyltransferase (E2) component
MPNLELERQTDVTTFRKIALGSWRDAYDPSVYGTIEVEMDRALDYIQEFRRKTGKHLTITHLMARAVAETLRQTPEANALLRFNRVYLRKRIGIFMQVVMTEEGSDHVDLSGATIYDVADKSLPQIIDEVEAKVTAVRRREDPALERSRGLFRYIPYLLLGLFLRLVSFLIFTLNLDLRRFGFPRDPFGSVMITNIGTLGLDTAYVPLIPYSRVAMLLAVGAVKEQPCVAEGKVVIRKVMRVSATFDHRFIDGFHAAVMARTVRRWLENPAECFGAIPAVEAGSISDAPPDGVSHFEEK